MCSKGGGFHLVELPDGKTVGRFEVLERLGTPHAVTARRGFDVGLPQADPAAAADGLARLLGLSGAAWLEQVHGLQVLAAGSAGLAGDGDALITDASSLGLVGSSADCPLVLVAAAAGEAVGMFHAGWRGIAAGMPGELVGCLVDRFGTDTAGVVACICPSAGPCCYEVGQDVHAAVVGGLGPRAEALFAVREGNIYFDMWSAIRAALVEAGLSDGHVHTAGVCTICHSETFPSYRAEGGRAGRFQAIIARKEQAK